MDSLTSSRPLKALKGLQPSTNQHVSVIRKELVALTHCSQLAIVLNQLLYWAQRVKDFDLFLEEERTCSAEDYPSLNYGWIYKTADELIKETLLTVTRPTMRKYLRMLVEDGWVEEKRNPERRWDHTAHFRLNLKRIHDELLSLGYKLSGFEKGLFPQDPTAEERNSFCKQENLIDENISHSDRLNNVTCNERNLPEGKRNLTSKLENFPSKERNLTPKLKNLTPYTYTENITENKNKEHTTDARAHTRVCEETCLEKNFSDVGDAGSDKSIAQEMVDLWEYHVLQKLDPNNWRGRIGLTEDRKIKLESLFAFHFKNDMRAWERFCLRVKSAPFLMGESPSGWHVSLDWILCPANLAKILEGNYKTINPMEKEASQEAMSFGNSEQNQAQLGRSPEKEAILASIKDPIWREWCTRLSRGTLGGGLKMTQEPLSALKLQQIANARFLDVEDKRLIWIGSSDPAVLNAIENLRLQISWVYLEDYPEARTLRTRLDSQNESLPHPVPHALSHPLSEGDKPHA